MWLTEVLPCNGRSMVAKSDRQKVSDPSVEDLLYMIDE